MGDKHSTFLQDFQSMSIILQQAFGGEEQKEEQPVQSREEALLAFKSVFG